MTEPVRSTRNPKVVGAGRLRRARDRRATGLTLLEGPILVAEAVAAGAIVHDVFALPDDAAAAAWAEAAGARLVVVTRGVLDRLAPTETPRGPIATMTIPSAAASHDRDVLELAVADPGNAGTLIRSAAAFGLDVVFSPGSVDLWSPKVLRAGAGGHFRVAIGEGLPTGVGRIATVVNAGDDVDAFDRILEPARRWAVMVGPEARGLAPDEVEAADVRVTVPMRGGVESLNAAVAGSIVAYELARWRNRVGGPSVER